MGNMYIKYVVLVASSVIVYINSFLCGFVFDDLSAIKDNHDLRPESSFIDLFKNDYWGTPMNQERSHKSYRPITVMTFRLNYWIHGLNPLGYHAVNVVLHSVVTVLFNRLSLHFLQDEPAFVTSLLFSVHPIHTDAVTGIVGRAELLSSILFIFTLLLYLRLSVTWKSKCKDWFNLCIIGLLMCVGTLCKEQCVTVFGVIVVNELFTAYQSYFIRSRFIKFSKMFNNMHEYILRAFSRINNKKSWQLSLLVTAAFIRILVLSLFLVAILFARFKVMAGSLPHFTEFDNPAAYAPSMTRRLTHLFLIPINLGLLIFPSFLCADWTLGSVKLISEPTDLRNIFTLLTFLCILYASCVGLSSKTEPTEARALIMALSIMAISFLPASNLFFPVGFVIAERVLYTPSLGFCLLIGLGYEKIGKFNLEFTAKQDTSSRTNVTRLNRKFIRCLVGTVLLVFTAKTIRRNFDWTDEYNLFTSAIKVNPNNAKMWNNVGHSLEAVGKFDEALAYFRKAVSVQPNDIGAHINVGRTYVNLGILDKAEKAYLTALDYFPKPKKGKTYYTRIAPKDLMVFINLANLYLNRTPPALDDAAHLLRRAISLRSDFIDAYQNYGSVLIKMGKLQEAVDIYKTALLYKPMSSDLNYNLGVVLLQTGQKDEGLGYIKLALSNTPDHQPSLFALASALSESAVMEDRNQAKVIYEALLHQNYQWSKVAFGLAMLETDMKNYAKSAEYYEAVIHVEPDHKSALFNLALLYRNHMNKSKRAAEILKTLIELHPTHLKSYLLFGDIELTENNNHEAAKMHFKRALELDSTNIQAKHNLCVALAQANELKESEVCLLEAIAMSSKADTYLTQHLSIVRARLQAKHAAADLDDD